MQSVSLRNAEWGMVGIDQEISYVKRVSCNIHHKIYVAQAAPGARTKWREGSN